MLAQLVLGALVTRPPPRAPPPRAQLTSKTRVEELRDAESTPSVEVRDAGVKGRGAFATRNFAAGEYVGPYVGTLTTDDETIARYCAENILSASLKCDYLFHVNDTYSIDAQNSTHFSRYFNHAEHGNLVSSTDEDELRVDFYAARDIAADEELTFDYGVRYWLWRDAPSADSDSRNFSEPKYRDLRPVEKTLLHPPPVGTVLPLTPLTAEELQAALALPEIDGPHGHRAALLRCLDYFGAARTDGGSLDVPFGVGDAAERRTLSPPELDDATLRAAAMACVMEAVVDPADASGAASAAFREWAADADAELGAIRRWRARTPRFASGRHDAAALAAYLLWKNPAPHGVTVALDKAGCNAIVGAAAGGDADGAIGQLAAHAPKEAVEALVEQLERWATLGDGCRVASLAPPALEGAVPQHYQAVWGRVPTLVEWGLL